MKWKKNFPGSRRKFSGKRKISKPQTYREIFRLEFPGGNTSPFADNSYFLLCSVYLCFPRPVPPWQTFLQASGKKLL